VGGLSSAPRDGRTGDKAVVLGKQRPCYTRRMTNDIIGAGNGWIPDELYKSIEASVPIVCVDVLLSPHGAPGQIGLIQRATYDDGFGWCLIGGRVLRNESLSDAVDRHVLATLGDNIRVVRSTMRLGAVIEYFSESGLGDFHDPRKHAVALTYTAACEFDGEPEVHGEAVDFRWFSIDDLRDIDFGFGQGEAVARVLKSEERL
jgi:ADP-ribose pyrophosphatase YjhB (NUDIX family)